MATGAAPQKKLQAESRGHGALGAPGQPSPGCHALRLTVHTSPPQCTPVPCLNDVWLYSSRFRKWLPCRPHPWIPFPHSQLFLLRPRSCVSPTSIRHLSPSVWGLSPSTANSLGMLRRVSAQGSPARCGARSLTSSEGLRSSPGDKPGCRRPHWPPAGHDQQQWLTPCAWGLEARTMDSGMTCWGAFSTALVSELPSPTSPGAGLSPLWPLRKRTWAEGGWRVSLYFSGGLLRGRIRIKIYPASYHPAHG